MSNADLALSAAVAHLEASIAAPKCHACACFQQTVEALADTEDGARELGAVLASARATFVVQRYDCLGCAECHPAVTANAFAEVYPSVAGLDLCPTEEPEVRAGWPPLPGDYRVVRYGAPVAVCTLNSAELASALAEQSVEGLAIVGVMHTENLGIERIIKNTLANPGIRFLLLCGEDTRQAVGHLPGQAVESLFANGIDDDGRIIGARGRRPVLKNVPRPELRASSSAHTMPNASIIPPPPRSPTIAAGATGPPSLRPMVASAPDNAM